MRPPVRPMRRRSRISGRRPASRSRRWLVGTCDGPADGCRKGARRPPAAGGRSRRPLGADCGKSTPLAGRRGRPALTLPASLSISEHVHNVRIPKAADRIAISTAPRLNAPCRKPFRKSCRKPCRACGWRDRLELPGNEIEKPARLLAAPGSPLRIPEAPGLPFTLDGSGGCMYGSGCARRPISR